MRVAVIVLLALGLAGLPEGRSSLNWGKLPCSLEEIVQGAANWHDHQVNSEWCWHSGSEKLYSRCLQMYWSKGLD